LGLGFLFGFVVLASAVASNTTRGCGDDPSVCSIGQNLEYIGQQAFDSPVLCGNSGRQFDPDWHLDHLLVDGVARANGLVGFTIFEVTPLGATLVLWGMFYLRFMAPILLPVRASLANLLSDRPKMKFLLKR